MTERDLLIAAVAAYGLAATWGAGARLLRPGPSAPGATRIDDEHWNALPEQAGDDVPRLTGGGRSTPTGDLMVSTLLWSALLLHTLALATRWQLLGHGPFTTLYEVLSSNLWSLALVLALLRGVLPELRTAWLAGAPVLLTLAAWMLLADPGAGHLPPTYATPLLYVHAVVGKLYLGLLLAAVALACMPLLRRSRWGARRLAHLGSDARFDDLAHRCAAAAFVFNSLMLIIGACWAQDAWGRYWAWDPLESWAFLSWLALAMTLHHRVTVKLAPHRHALLLAGVFVLAFLTFFGVPFVSISPHKGAV
jgi:ABC-type transport system involved in cytochrome c biogenesis permease subunit